MLLCPCNSSGKNTGVGRHPLLQGIFPTQGLNPGLLCCSWILYHLSHQGSPFRPDAPFSIWLIPFCLISSVYPYCSPTPSSGLTLSKHLADPPWSRLGVLYESLLNHGHGGCEWLSHCISTAPLLWAVSSYSTGSEFSISVSLAENLGHSGYSEKTLINETPALSIFWHHQSLLGSTQTLYYPLMKDS